MWVQEPLAIHTLVQSTDAVVVLLAFFPLPILSYLSPSAAFMTSKYASEPSIPAVPHLSISFLPEPPSITSQPVSPSAFLLKVHFSYPDQYDGAKLQSRLCLPFTEEPFVIPYCTY